MFGWCNYFNCFCDEVTEELQKEYGEHCLIECEKCECKED